jgi:hypothetical protein
VPGQEDPLLVWLTRVLGALAPAQDIHDILRAEHIDLEALPLMQDEHFKALHIKVGVRVRVTKALRSIGTGLPPTPLRTSMAPLANPTPALPPLPFPFPTKPRRGANGEGKQGRMCCVCFLQEVNCAFQCGHCKTCMACAGQLSHCPLCQKEIVCRMKMSM